MNNQQPNNQTVNVCIQKCGPRPKMNPIHYLWLLWIGIGWIIFIFPFMGAKRRQKEWDMCMMQCQSAVANGQNPNAMPEYKHPKYGEPINDPTNLFNYTEYHNQKVRAKKGIKESSSSTTNNTYSGSYWDQPEEVKSVEVEVDDK